jgi:hypothetical protein
MVDNWAPVDTALVLLQMTNKMISQGVAHLTLNNVHVPQPHTRSKDVTRSYY